MPRANHVCCAVRADGVARRADWLCGAVWLGEARLDVAQQLHHGTNPIVLLELGDHSSAALLADVVTVDWHAPVRLQP